MNAGWRPDPLPEWVAEVAREWQRQKRTGTLQIHYKDGGVRNLTEQQTRNPPGVKDDTR